VSVPDTTETPRKAVNPTPEAKRAQPAPEVAGAEPVAPSPQPTAVAAGGEPAVAAPAAAAPEESPLEVRRAEFQPLQPRVPTEPRANIGLLMDVTVTVTIELGSTELPLRDILELGPGSVVQLDRVLGEPVDILINRELVGKGEVVVVGDQFGVRVTQLLNPEPDAK
jgi:flagellar motor switch protein FliN/FliY